MSDERKREISDFIEFLLSKEQRKQKSYEERFNMMLVNSRSHFKEWLMNQGYETKSLTDDEIERIIQNA